MISWIADNATLLYLLLGVIAVALGLRWRTTRQGKYLIGLGVVVGLVGLVVILSLTIVTARQQLVRAVEETAQQINAKNFDGAFRNFADKVFLEVHPGDKGEVPREALQKLAQDSMRSQKITGIEVWNIEVESLDPVPVVSFYLRATDYPGYANCRAELTQLGEGTWRVQKLKLVLPGNWRVPFPR